MWYFGLTPESGIFCVAPCQWLNWHRSIGSIPYHWFLSRSGSSGPRLISLTCFLNTCWAVLSQSRLVWLQVCISCSCLQEWKSTAMCKTRWESSSWCWRWMQKTTVKYLSFSKWQWPEHIVSAGATTTTTTTVGHYQSCLGLSSLEVYLYTVFPFPWIINTKKWGMSRDSLKLHCYSLILLVQFPSGSCRQFLCLRNELRQILNVCFYCFGVFGVIVRDIVVTREGAKSQGRAIHPTKCQLCDIHTKDSQLSA